MKHTFRNLKTKTAEEINSSLIWLFIILTAFIGIGATLIDNLLKTPY